MKRWNTLAEWIRWILCWPIILLGLILSGIVMYGFANMFLDQFWIPDIAATILHPALATILGCQLIPFLFSTFIPRRSDIVATVPMTIVVLLGLMSAVRWWYEIMDNLVPSDVLLTDIFQTLAAIFVWVYVYFKLRSDYPAQT